MRIKSGMRIIAWDDAPFEFSDKSVLLIGSLVRGDKLEAVLTARIKKDGLDSTDKIAESINRSKYHNQAKLIMLDGITFGGFNIVDLELLHKKTGLPIIVIIKNRPNLNNISEALSKFKDRNKRLKLIEKAGQIKTAKVNNKSTSGIICYQSIGIGDREAEKVISQTAVNSLVPEPVRISHIIASGLRGI